ncbi:MAG: serine/threonine-protein kinase [Planctomycetota bacterium]
MNAEQFQQIERVFHAALALEAAARSAFVAEQLAGAPELQTEVRRLLEAAERGTAFLETSLWVAGPPTKDGPAPPLPARMIGPYRLIRELGRGGMGVVYEAEQSMPHRRVALKLVDGGPWGDATRWPGHEPRILGRLNHPSVAAIYDASQTLDGRSYFVMELIEGERLDEYVRKHNVPRRERLKLFCQVCDAIQHAHAKSVIHLDLKPSNILVTATKDRDGGEPQVKVVDFGVAAITGGDTTHTGRGGATSAFQGTLAYMSPEQRRGDQDAIDVRSDVYALGVVLFKLMTGELPYPVEGLPIPEAWRVFEQQEPRRPRALDPSVPHDIDTIIRTATAEEPARRYQSVADLVGDVRRYLTDLPIMARRPSKLYELAKFTKRNKALVALFAAIVLGLSGTVVGTSTMYIRAKLAQEEARSQAEANRRLAELIVGTAPGETTDERSEPSPAVRRAPLATLRNHAWGLLSQGQLEEAERAYSYLVKLAKAVLPAGNWYLAELQGEYGECLIRLGRYPQAELPLLSSYEGLLSSRGAQHPHTVEAVSRLIRLYNAWGKPDEVEHWRTVQRTTE